MREDSIGMFWEDIPSERGRSNVARPMAEIPETGWKAPTYFPNLENEACLSIDVETYDPELLIAGPGWGRGVGHIVGIVIGAPSGGRWYYPIRHTVCPEQNLDPDSVLAWFRTVLSNPKQPKVGANILYDVGWLAEEGIDVAGELIDVQYAEALLDEYGRTGLDTLGEKYLGESKKTELLYQWCADSYGGNPTGKQRENIWRSPPSLVGPYAESDADLPLRVIAKQFPILRAQGLLELFEMECKLIPLLLRMRRNGVRVSVEKAERVSQALDERCEIEKKKIKKLLGFEISVNSSNDIAAAFTELRIPFKHTATGRPSFTKNFLEECSNPLAKLIMEVRRLEKLNGTFIKGAILDKNVNGRVYGSFHPLRGDSGGAKSGRFSSSDPNLQNIPARDPELAPLIRGMFIPEEGHVGWRKYDYSQIEYRMLAHFAVGRGAENLRRIFIENPKADFHEETTKLIEAVTGIHLGRKQTKGINFGLTYGMGIALLAKSLHVSRAEASRLFEAYHMGAPFVQETIDYYQREATNRGYVTTIMNRRARFEKFVPVRWHKGDSALALPYHQAIAAYGRVERAHTHTTLNRVLQGSAADIMKKAMVDAYEAGIFDATGIPVLTVHDELDFSDPGTHYSNEGFKALAHTMETCYPTKIPIRVDGEFGPDWGSANQLTVS